MGGQASEGTQEGKIRLTVYADNCSGQTKNNYLIKFLLAEATWEFCSMSITMFSKKDILRSRVVAAY
ncbi:Hypothetical protein PHPALM_21205 [Phytophthora palmivora]|uniref:Uncharacterized protein n=1 Tax=Phytophthora palmivora TaxID=4796 RepID=A0A2P4XCX4_9STRA|nr:Hypothetical protein PHPALM_21205 [Phytophthora palmivora]